MKRAGHVRRVEIVGRDDVGPLPETAYLSLHRLELINTFADGSQGPRYPYDAVLRKWLDAVALLLVAEIDGAPAVCLRSCVRPPLLLREDLALPLPAERRYDSLWELPAGLLEAADTGPSGIKRRAAIEAREEAGYALTAADFELLPGAPFVSPGVLPERIFFARATITDPGAGELPAGDGSAVEERADIWWVGLAAALEMCDRGEIEDLKTELGLRRLAARGYPSGGENR